MSDRFESLESGEVVSIQHEAEVLSGHRTFRAGELNEAIKSYVEKAIPGWSAEKNDWFTDRGIDCEALRFGSQGWQKGRIRVSLEFCPDEPTAPALSASSSIPAALSSADTANPSLTLSATPTQTTTANHHDDTVVHSSEPDVLSTTVAPVAQFSEEPLVEEMGNVATVAVAAVATNLTIPHLADAVLEPEHHAADPIAPHSEGLDEIAFDFDLANNDQGRMIPNGMMELDLNDFGTDLSEHDLLSFEATGMSVDSEGFGNFQDQAQPENSGMLIDEVWNEMNQATWPVIN
jgi:KGK domain